MVRGDLKPPVHPTVHARVVAAREQEARRRRFRQISHGTPPIYQTKFGLARPQTSGPGSIVSASPPPPNYSYVGYVSADGLEQRLLSQHIGRDASKQGGSRNVLGAPPSNKWSADARKKAEKEHERAEEERRLALRAEGGATEGGGGYYDDDRRWAFGGGGDGGSGDGGDRDGEGRLVPYTKLLSRGEEGAAYAGDVWPWWEEEEYAHEATDCCTFFARLCRWPCAAEELKRDGMLERTGGEGPGWLGALRKAHRRVNYERDGGGIDYRQTI